MRYSVAAALLAATAMACDTCHYNGTVHYTTEVVSEYSTYCPYATHLSFNGVTYTVTEATTLVVTNCPCTITKPVPVTQATSVPVTPVYVSSVETPVVVSSSVPAVPVAPVTPVTPVSPPAVVTPPPVVPSFVNATTVLPTGTGSPAPPVSPSVEAFKGAGSRVAASGASLVAVLGLAAFFL